MVSTWHREADLYALDYADLYALDYYVPAYLAGKDTPFSTDL